MLKKVLNAIAYPTLIQSIILIVFDIAFIALSIIATIIPVVSQVLSYAVYLFYTLGAMGLTDLIYLIIYAYKNFKKSDIRLKINIKSEFLNKLIKDYGFRSKIVVIFILLLSIGFMIYNITLSFVNEARWNWVMGLYYFIITILYGLIVFRIYAKAESIQKDIYTYIYSGVGLLIVPAAITWAEVELLSNNFNIYYGEFFIYIVALFAFIKVGVAIGNMKVSSKYSDYTVKAIKAVNFIDALVTLMILQQTLLDTFGNDLEVSFASHGIFCIVINSVSIALGISMIYKGIKAKKSITNDSDENFDEIKEKDVF